MAGMTEAQLQAIAGAVEEGVNQGIKKALVSNTVAASDHSKDIIEIKSDVKLIREKLDAGDKHFERLDKCIESLTQVSSKQETRLSLIEQTQSNCKEGKKSFVAVLLSGIAVVGSIVGIIIQHLLKK